MDLLKNIRNGLVVHVRDGEICIDKLPVGATVIIMDDSPPADAAIVQAPPKAAAAQASKDAADGRVAKVAPAATAANPVTQVDRVAAALTPEPSTVDEIARRSGVTRDRVGITLCAPVKSQRAIRHDKGRYSLPASILHTAPPQTTDERPDASGALLAAALSIEPTVRIPGQPRLVTFGESLK